MTVEPYYPVILIHGAWQGSWVWDRLLPILDAKGLAFDALDLPGNGVDATRAEDVSLDLYVDHIGTALARCGGRANLVAHSGAGIIASAVAERFPTKVAGIAYVAGMMLPSGLSYGDFVRVMVEDHPEAAGIAPHLIWSTDGCTSTVPVPVAKAFFFDDCAPEDASVAAGRLTPQPERGRAISVSLTAERFGRARRLYIETAVDRSIVLACQRKMQSLVPGATVISLDTGHAPQLAAPGLLGSALLPFLLARSPEYSLPC